MADDHILAASDSPNSHSSAFEDSDEALEVPKNNLAAEDEFRPVDNKKPIQIFIKMKPLTGNEVRVQANQRLYEFHGDTGVSVLPPASSFYAKNKQLKTTVF
jgi:hypothetical protein